MNRLILKEAEIYKISHSMFENFEITDEMILNEATKTIENILPHLVIWKNINIILENTPSSEISFLEKNSYKVPTIHIYTESIKSNSKKLHIPSELITSNAIYFCIGKALIDWDKKSKYYLLDIDNEEIYCEQFAYNIYYLDFKIENDVKSLITKILNSNENLSGYLPLNTISDLAIPKDDVRSQLGNLGGQQKKKPTMDHMFQDENGNYYDDYEISDLILKYKQWCLTHQKTPISDDNIDSKYISYIKNIITT